MPIRNAPGKLATMSRTSSTAEPLARRTSSMARPSKLAANTAPTCGARSRDDLQEPVEIPPRPSFADELCTSTRSSAHLAELGHSFVHVWQPMRGLHPARELLGCHGGESVRVKGAWVALQRALEAAGQVLVLHARLARPEAKVQRTGHTRSTRRRATRRSRARALVLLSSSSTSPSDALEDHDVLAGEWAVVCRVRAKVPARLVPRDDGRGVGAESLRGAIEVGVAGETHAPRAAHHPLRGLPHPAQRIHDSRLAADGTREAGPRGASRRGRGAGVPRGFARDSAADLRRPRKRHGESRPAKGGPRRRQEGRSQRAPHGS